MKTSKELIQCGYWAMGYGIVLSAAGLAGVITLQRDPLSLNALHVALGLSLFAVGARLGASKYALAHPSVERAVATAMGRRVALMPAVLLVVALGVVRCAEWLKTASPS